MNNDNGNNDDNGNGVSTDSADDADGKRQQEDQGERVPCSRCDGCGKIANDEEGTPWIAWQSLPPGSDMAVRLGQVVPLECPKCGGSGSADDWPRGDTEHLIKARHAGTDWATIAEELARIVTDVKRKMLRLISGGAACPAGFEPSLAELSEWARTGRHDRPGPPAELRHDGAGPVGANGSAVTDRGSGPPAQQERAASCRRGVVPPPTARDLLSSAVDAQTGLTTIVQDLVGRQIVTSQLVRYMLAAEIAAGRIDMGDFVAHFELDELPEGAAKGEIYPVVAIADAMRKRAAQRLDAAVVGPPGRIANIMEQFRVLVDAIVKIELAQQARAEDKT